MKKTQILKILIPIMDLALIFQLFSGLAPAIIPYAIHRAAGILLVTLVILHAILNWPWIRANYLKR